MFRAATCHHLVADTSDVTCEHSPTKIEADLKVKHLDAAVKLTFIRINFGCFHVEQLRLSLKDFLTF